MIILFDRSAVRGALHAGFCNVDLQLVPGQGIGIEHADGLVGFGLGSHGDKGKALGQAAVPVLDQINHGDFSSLGEKGFDFRLGG